MPEQARGITFNLKMFVKAPFPEVFPDLKAGLASLLEDDRHALNLRASADRL